MHDLPFDLTSLHQAYRDGIRPEDVVRESFRRIAAAGDKGIFISLIDEAAAVAEAAGLGPFDPVAKPLWGLPFAVKDNIDIAGIPTTAGCPAYGYLPRTDAFVIARLREAGAIPVGKTNLDQFATGLVGVRSPYPVPKNAIDPEIVPGGSSSGSGVAVARGLVCFSLGTDTAGSGRVPAALNNIVGLKPSLGAFSATGVVPACRTLDTVSVFALTAEDAYRVFQQAAVYDEADAYSRPFAAPDIGKMPERFRVGVPSRGTREFCGDKAQAISYEASLEAIEELGGEIVEFDFAPFAEVAAMLYEGPWVAERHTVIEELMTARPDEVHPVIRQIVGKATGFSATDTFRYLYRLEDHRRQLGEVVRSLDMICVPTIPTFFSVADLEKDPVGPNSRLGTYTNFVNLLDLCGIAVPVPTRNDGRPGSVTLLAPAGRDGLLAALAATLHKEAGVTLGATGWTYPDMHDPEPVVTGDEIAIAAVGAHMSGLPLNGELTKLGARYIRTTTTTPGYRLYSLAGGPPFRPGLIRDAGGAAIELEVWALPVEQFGAFMKGIPSPLGIGTVSLASGEQVNGFICETAGLDGARDITEFGGWRNFLAAETTQLRAIS